MGVRATLRRYHVWLGWLVGVPVLLWTVSGLIMVAKPIDEVRGNNLIAPVGPLGPMGALVAPNLEGRPASSIKLENRGGQPRWIIMFNDGGSRLADPATGALQPAMSAADAAREVSGRYTGKASIVATRRIDPQHPPIELRKKVDAWRVEMSDGTRFYVDAGSGDIIAKRTGWWRFYDFMWGIHIMDLQGREDPHNPWVATFGLLTAIMSVLAVILLFLTTRKKKQQAPASVR